MSFTGHRISNDFVYHHAALDVTHFPGSHTGKDVRDMYKLVMNAWNLNDKMHIEL